METELEVMIMKTEFWMLTILLSAMMLNSGCIVHDQNTTLVINEDGSADMTILRSNIRSTASGDRANEQIADFRAALNERTHDDFKRLRGAGATVEMSMWLREQVPMAHVLRASIPNRSSLEKMATLRDSEGAVVVDPDFSVNGTRRRLGFRISIDPESISKPAAGGSGLEAFMEQRATAMSDIRICVSEGEISAASGFRIADDGRSALFDEDKIKSLIQCGDGEAEIFIEWDVQ